MSNNRQLKFRVWCPETKKWIIEWDELSCLWRVCFGDRTVHRIQEWPYIIQQFTGLLDKNNKEIYEGDILLFGGLKYEVYWNGWRWDAQCPYHTRYHWPRFNSEFGMRARSSAIVGNVFENKNLLTNE